MAPHFIYISGAAGTPPVTDYWLDYDGTLNDNSVLIVDPATSGSPEVGNNARLFVGTAGPYYIAKYGSNATLVSNTLNAQDTVDLTTASGVSANIQGIAFFEKTLSNFMIIASNTPVLGNGMDVRVLEYTAGSGTFGFPNFGFGQPLAYRMFIDAISSGTFNLDTFQAIEIDDAGDSTVFIYYTGSGTVGAIVDDAFTTAPDERTQGGGRIPSQEALRNPQPLASQIYRRFNHSPTSSQLVACYTGRTTPVPGDDKCIVYVAERVNQVFGAGLPTVDGMRPLGGQLDLEFYLFQNGGVGGDGAFLLAPEVIKLPNTSNQYLAATRYGAVLFSVDTSLGGGTVLDSVAFSTDVQNSGAVFSTSEAAVPFAAAPVNIAAENFQDVILQFDKGGATGAIPFRYFHLVVRVNTVTQTITNVGSPIQADQNITSGPAFEDYHLSLFTESEIINFWTLGSGSDRGLAGAKIKR